MGTGPPRFVSFYWEHGQPARERGATGWAGGLKPVAYVTERGGSRRVAGIRCFPNIHSTPDTCASISSARASCFRLGLRFDRLKRLAVNAET